MATQEMRAVLPTPPKLLDQVRKRHPPAALQLPDGRDLHPLDQDGKRLRHPDSAGIARAR